MPLEIKTTPLRTFGQVVVLDGALDTDGAPKLRAELERLIAADSPLVVLDLAALSYVNSQGLRVLQTGMREMARGGGELKLINPQPAVAQVLEIVRMGSLGDKYADLDELDAHLHRVQAGAPETGSTGGAPGAAGAAAS